MSENYVVHDWDGGVATVAFNRPDALNAFTPELLELFVDVMDTVQESTETRCIILEGTGRAFSAGLDLKLLQDAKFEAGHVNDLFGPKASSAFDATRLARVPVIAKVHGGCFTGALELALQADFILTTVDTKFGDTHARFGLRPSGGMSQHLPRAVGIRRARELSFTGAVFTGEEAVQWGVANAAFASREELDAATAKRAHAIAEASPGAIAAYKDLYRYAEGNPTIEAALAEEKARQYPEITDTAQRLSMFRK